MTDVPAPRRALAREADVISTYVNELAASAGWRPRHRGDRPAATAAPRALAPPRIRPARRPCLAGC